MLVAGAASKTVMQQGSLAEGEIFVSVQMQYGTKQLQAELLVDTGCDLDLNISEYKAAQLGLPLETRAVKLDMGQGAEGLVRRR